MLVSSLHSAEFEALPRSHNPAHSSGDRYNNASLAHGGSYSTHETRHLNSWCLLFLSVAIIKATDTMASVKPGTTYILRQASDALV